VSERAKAIGTLAVWVALIAAVDQGIKGLVVANLSQQSPIHLLGPFSLTYQTNTGAAFSLLHDTHSVLILLLNALVLAFFLYLIRPYLNLRAGRLAAALVLGGAAGNLIDRVVRHHVVDYVNFYVSPQLHWPVFNLADTCIVIGVALLVLLVLRSERTRSDEPESDPEGISA